MCVCGIRLLPGLVGTSHNGMTLAKCSQRTPPFPLVSCGCERDIALFEYDVDFGIQSKLL